MQKFPKGLMEQRETNFVKKIKEGVKKTTIREDAKGRWKAGNKIHFCTGGYKPGRIFFESVALEVKPISITWNKLEYCDSAKVVIGENDALYYSFDKKTFNGAPMKSYFDSGLEEVAKNDGFDSVEDFFKYFNKDFKGKIIYW